MYHLALPLSPSVGILMHSQRVLNLMLGILLQSGGLVWLVSTTRKQLTNDGGLHKFLTDLAAAVKYRVGFSCRVLVGLPDKMIKSDWFQFYLSRWASKMVYPNFKDYHLAHLAQDTLSVPAQTCSRDKVGLLTFQDDSRPQRERLFRGWYEW